MKQCKYFNGPGSWNTKSLQGVLWTQFFPFVNWVEDVTFSLAMLIQLKNLNSKQRQDKYLSNIWLLSICFFNVYFRTYSRADVLDMLLTFLILILVRRCIFQLWRFSSRLESSKCSAKGVSLAVPGIIVPFSFLFSSSWFILFWRSDGSDCSY